MSSDRTVHARLTGGGEVVRYDSAGKWYVENEDECSRLSLDEAVFLATFVDSEAFLGRPGGRQFDAAVRKLVHA